MIKFHNDINPTQKLKVLKKFTDKFLKNKNEHIKIIIPPHNDGDFK